MGVVMLPQHRIKPTCISAQRKQAAAIRSHLEKAFALPSISLAVRRSRARKQRRSSKDSSLSPSTKSTSTSKPLGFLDLPSELRLQIYGYALAREGRMYLDKCKAPALAAVNRQIRNESLPVFLEVNQFSTLLCQQPDLSFGIWFSETTLSWLRSVPLSKPLIRDITFALQPTNWEDGDFLVEDFRIRVSKEGAKLAHGRDCPFCQDGTYGKHVLSLPSTHPALSRKFKEIITASQMQHDRNLEATTPFFVQSNTALTLQNVIDLAAPFSGPSEVYTAEQTGYRSLVDYLVEEIEEWEEEDEGERKEIEDKMEVVVNELFGH